MGVGDDGSEVDFEVQEADCWGTGVVVVGQFVAAEYQVNAVCLSFGGIDVEDKVGIGYFLPLGVECLETKKMVLAPSTSLEGRRDLSQPYSRQKTLLVVEISQVAFSGPEQKVWREDLVPVMVSIPAAALVTTGRG